MRQTEGECLFFAEDTNCVMKKYFKTKRGNEKMAFNKLGNSIANIATEIKEVY